jgi:hypothetical protein
VNMERANTVALAVSVEVPNVDDSSVEDIRRISDEALALASDFMALSAYASAKALAIRYRTEGHIQDALKYERRADEQYNKLPPWMRW